MSDKHTRFPGAQPFSDDELSRRLFFGRQQETTALRNQVLAHRLTVLFARSGLGKTSLINAGISDGLIEAGYLPLSVRVNDPTAGALASIYDGIAKQCLRHGIEHLPGCTDSLWLYFKTTQFWYDDRLLEPILILDQFEEMFTLQPTVNREAFVRDFSQLMRGVAPGPEVLAKAAVSAAPPHLHVLIAIREDFLANMEEFADRVPDILAERFRLLPLERAQAARAIEEPTTVISPDLLTQPFRIDKACQEAVLDFLERRSAAVRRGVGNAIEPFQLQLLCQHIESIARGLPLSGGDELPVVGLAAIGGARALEGVLRRFYRTQLRCVPWIQRTKARRLCAEHLVTLQGRRVRLEESEIDRLCGVKPATLGILIDRRVIRRDQTAEGQYYELSHDSLVGPAVAAWRYRFIGKLAMLVIGVILLSIFIAIYFAEVVTWFNEWVERGGANLEWGVNTFYPMTLLLVLFVLVALVRRLLRLSRDYLRRSRL